MFEIDQLDFIGNDGFEEIVRKLFGNLPMERVEEDGVPSLRIHIPRKGDTSIARNKQVSPTPAWRQEVVAERDENPVPPVEMPKDEPKKAEPKSIIEMLEDGDERLEQLLGKIIDKKLAERGVDRKDEEDEEPVTKYNPNVFIANRLTFLIQTKLPIVFDTSTIETDTNTMTIALNEDKTIPRISDYDEVGFITSEINRDVEIQKEISEFLDGSDFDTIYCLPTIMRLPKKSVYAVKFVIHSKK